MGKAAKPKLTKDRKAEAIAACRDKSGRLTPTAVWQTARDPDHVLHGEFEWDVKKAAEREWERRAAELIREVRITVQYEDRVIAIPYYVSDPRDDRSSYVPTARVAKNPVWAERVMRDELERIRASVHRAKGLATAFNFVNQFDLMLDQVMLIERRLDGDDDGDETHP